MPSPPRVAEQARTFINGDVLRRRSSFPSSIHNLNLEFRIAMRPDEQPLAPSQPWQIASAFTMGAVGALCRGFLYGLSTTEVHGLDTFLQLLDARENVERRERGLITGNSTADYAAIYSDFDYSLQSRICVCSNACD
jgi:hypothetical protein